MSEIFSHLNCLIRLHNMNKKYDPLNEKSIATSNQSRNKTSQVCEMCTASSVTSCGLKTRGFRRWVLVILFFYIFFQQNMAYVFCTDMVLLLNVHLMGACTCTLLVDFHLKVQNENFYIYTLSVYMAVVLGVLLEELQSQFYVVCT